MSTSVLTLAFVRDDLDGAGGLTVREGEVTPAGGAGAEQVRRVLALGPEAFGTPYEAVAWSILSARGPMARAEELWRLHDVAEAALDGLLDATTLAALPEDEALARLKALRGIGGFYAELVLDRAVRPG